MLAVSLLLAVNLAQEPQPGQRFIALPGIADIYRDTGPSEARMKPLDPLTVAFHELTFTFKDKEDYYHFKLEDKTTVKVARTDPFQPHILVPSVQSPELKRARARFQGRRIWSYKDLEVSQVWVMHVGEAFIHIAPGKSLKIEGIYQIGKVPIQLGKRSSYQVGDYGKGNPFLVVYSLDKPRGGTESEPFNVFLGTRILDQLFSLKPL